MDTVKPRLDLYHYFKGHLHGTVSRCMDYVTTQHLPCTRSAILVHMQEVAGCAIFGLSLGLHVQLWTLNYL